MGSAEKELEEQLLDVGNRILAPPSSVDELLPLLDQAESFLSRVEQSPSKSMLDALDPAMTGLTAKELLGHSDTDVKVSVASCISEITRITAPEAPYDDGLMKEIFEMIVEAFGKLEDISSRSFLKRVSILETVAKVRSCVVMLDLECDSLILEMFHHFLNTIRDDHPEYVFSSMEMIMTVVLEESEDISSDLLSCLLMSVKKDNKDILPIARVLAEKVIGNCVLKLKPSLVEAVQSMGAPLDGYSEIVASICQGSSDVLEQNGVNVSSECLAGKSKVSGRVVSEEMPQSLQKVELEIACPDVSAAADKFSRSSVSNGTVQTGIDGSLGEPTLASKKTVHSRRSALFKNATAARLKLEKLDTLLDHGTKKARGQKSNPAVQPTENSNPSQLETVESPIRRKGHGREVNTLQSGGASKNEAPATKMENIEKTTGHHVTSERPSNTSASVILATDNQNLPDSSRPKRGRFSRSKNSKKKVVRSPEDDVPVLRLGLKRCPVNGNSEDEAASSVDIDTTKQTEGISGSEKKPLRCSGKKGYLENLDNGGKSKSHSNTAMDVMADPEEKLHRRPGRKPQTKMANEGKASENHRISKTKKQKDRASSEGIVGDDANQKGMLSSTETPPITKANKDQNLSDEGLKRKSRKKRAREEISEIPHGAIKYDESLVGAKIKVWWPDDEEFYPGVVDSYDLATLSHKVLYADGDEEVLLLKNETFKFLKGEKQGERKNVSTPEMAETPWKKAKKSDSSVKRSKVVASSTSGESAGKVSANRSKPGRKSGLSPAQSTRRRRPESSKTDVQTPTESISKEKKRRRHNVDTPKDNILSEDELDIKSKDETPRATKTKDNIAKRGRKSKSGTPKNGGGLKDDSSVIGSAKSEASTPGSKGKDDATGTRRKPKRNIASPGKSRSKPDANGAAKVKSGSSKRLQTEHVVTKVSANAGVSQESEKRRKKRRKNSLS